MYMTFILPVYISDSPSFVRSYIAPSDGLTLTGKSVKLSAAATLFRVVKCPLNKIKGHVAFQLAEDRSSYLRVMGDTVRIYTAQLSSAWLTHALSFYLT